MKKLLAPISFARVAMLAVSVLLAASPMNVRAAAFTAGNIVVEQIGDGSTTLGSGSLPINLLEYNGTTLAQTIPLPTAVSGANQIITASGSATSEGQMTRSSDGRYLCVVGYNVASGTASAKGTASRTTARIGADGTVDSSTTGSPGGTGDNARSAGSSDGSGFWTSHATQGLFYEDYDGLSMTKLSTVNTRVVAVVNGQLYYSTGSGTAGIYSLGAGLPTNGTPTATLQITDGGTSPSPYGFSINPAGTVAYVADDRTIANGGGIIKYTYSGGVWSSAVYTLNPSTGSATTFGARGLAVDWSGANPVIYATTSESSLNRLVKITDTGSGSTATLLATATANYIFRGIAFAPANSVTLSLNNTGTPAAGSIVTSTANVPLFGFQLNATGGSVNFTGLKLTTAGTATTSDLSNFRVIWDADSSGTFNAGDVVVSDSAQPLANPINFTFTGQSVTGTSNYLVIANVAAGATVGHTFTASIAAAGDVTASVTPTGTAAGNQQTVAAAAFDLTMTPVTSSESPTISSLTNDATITTTSQGTQVWQVTFNNPAGNAGAGTITALTFSQGANNGVANWQNTIQAAELFDGSTALAAGTITSTNINFSGLSAVVADNGSKTLTLQISLKSTSGALTDNANFQFALAAAGVTLTGNNGMTTAAINSDQTLNKIDVVATKLAFTLVPTYVVINTAFTVQVSAQDANGNLDLDDNTSSVNVSLLTGSGILLHGGSQTLTGGNKKWTTLSYDTVEQFSLTATDDGSVLTTATSANITALAAPALTEVVMPQYIQGGNSGAKRVPYAYRVAISNLLPSATYRYYNQVVISTDTATTDGAGNPIFASASGSFVRTTSPGLTTAGNYGTFITDANGSYTGWFITETTSNARFAAGTADYMRIMLNDGNGGTTVSSRVTTPDAATALAFGTTADATTGTGIYGNSSATAKNFAVLYDNTDGTGRPLAATMVESDGVTVPGGSSGYVSFYTNYVDGVAGAWGNIIPNTNPNGVQRIEQRALADGSLVGFNTNSTGAWPSGANTVNPTGGDATPIVITSTDAPLLASGTTYTITATQSANGSIIPSGVTTVNSGDSTNYSITPNVGYSVATLTVDGSTVTPATSYAFNNVTANHTITATFAPINYTLTYNAGANGTISGTTPQTVAYLASGSLVTATPNTGYHFTTWSDSLSTASRTDVANIGGTNVTASFAINTYTVGYDGNGNTGGTAPVDASSPYNYNSTVTTKTAGSLVKTGYSFAGWNTVANGTGTGYATNATFAITANTTLFAQWTFIPIITKITVTGGNVLIDFTGGTTDSTGNFTVVGTTNLTTALTPVAPSANITTSGAGLFRATLGVSNSAAFYRIKR